MEMTAERKGVQLTQDKYSVQYLNQCDYTHSDMKKKNTVHCPLKPTSAKIDKCQTKYARNASEKCLYSNLVYNFSLRLNFPDKTKTIYFSAKLMLTLCQNKMFKIWVHKNF
jgi:hypothetical protein